MILATLVNRKWLLLWLSLSSVIGCESPTCSDEKFDDQSFTTETTNWNIYNSIEGLVFVDKFGKEYVYTKDRGFLNSRLYLFTEDCHTKPRKIQYNGDYALVGFNGPDKTDIAVAFFVTFLDHETNFAMPQIVDLMGVSILDVTVVPNVVVSRLKHITSNRNGTLDKDAFNNSQSVSKDKIELFGRTFLNVIEQTDFTNAPIVCNQEFGVLSFSNRHGVTLVFDRFLTK